MTKFSNVGIKTVVTVDGFEFEVVAVVEPELNLPHKSAEQRKVALETR
jgi:hypothetical protein